MGKKPYTMYLPPSDKMLFEELATQRGMSLTVWLLQAGRAYAKTARKFNNQLKLESKPSEQRWPSGWPKAAKCGFCGLRTHDPLDAHSDWEPNEAFWSDAEAEAAQADIDAQRDN